MTPLLVSIGAALALFMATPWSYPAWDRLRLRQARPWPIAGALS
jgi:hypothetical protein